MGTEILHPQDCLIERLRFNPPSFSPRRNNYSNHNTNPNPKSCRKQPESRKRSPPPPRQSEPLISKPAKNLALGQVTILKRGESLYLKRKDETLKKTFSADFVDLKRKNESKKKNENLKKTFSGDLLLCGAERLGPDPELVPVRLSDLKPLNLGSNVYAGSAFALSPSPRKLPLPKFSIKKEGFGFPGVDDSATKDLRRLLRID